MKITLEGDEAIGYMQNLVDKVASNQVATLQAEVDSLLEQLRVALDYTKSLEAKGIKKKK